MSDLPLSEPVIAVRGLVKRHGDRVILDALDLDVFAGTVAALIGPSGGGKSTLIRCLNALEPFQAGTVRVGQFMLKPGADAAGANLVPLRREVGMVFQQFHLFPHLSALGNVTLAPRQVLRLSREDAEARGRELLARVGLGDFADARPASLSGGQQQRVAIARALAVRPEVILFDEPTSALDPQMAQEVEAVIAGLARDGQTMVVVTHSMDFVRRVATTVHRMAAGKIVASGPPGEVL